MESTVVETNQEIAVPQEQKPGVKFKKNAPRKSAKAPGEFFNSKIGSVPSGGIGLTAINTEETINKSPKTFSSLRKK